MAFEIKKSVTVGEIIMVLGLLVTALLWFFKTGGQLQSIIDRQSASDQNMQTFQKEMATQNINIQTQNARIETIMGILNWNHFKGPSSGQGVPQ